jgi:DNA-binding NtrC family response regulator
MTQVAVRSPLQSMIGTSPSTRRIGQLVQKVGLSRVPVLLWGESGTGKEVAARAIHDVRSQGAFVPIDCGALPSNLIESELFGHERGAFTGAQTRRVGLLQQAHGGTAFFDEVGELPLEAQAKLLRTLQQQEIRPVGSDSPRPCVFRIIAATNRDLNDEVKHKRFRLDLYYRLNVVSLQLPPLRERKEDIPLLFDHFLRRADTGKKPEPGLIDAILEHDWPGNIRELENCVARLVALATDAWLRVEELPFGPKGFNTRGCMDGTSEAADPTVPSFAATIGESRSRMDIGETPHSMAQAERAVIERAIVAARGSRGSAAKALGISRTTLYRRLKRYEGDTR